MAAANRLLVVDDEAGITRVIEAAAREVGFEVMSINETDHFEKALGAINYYVIPQIAIGLAPATLQLRNSPDIDHYCCPDLPVVLSRLEAIARHPARRE